MQSDEIVQKTTKIACAWRRELVLIAKKDLNEVFAQYHPELDKCGNRVYWVQVIGNRNNAYPKDLI